MADWLASIAKIRREVPDDVLVLPAHNDCFRGLHARLDYLASSQHRALDALETILVSPQRAVDVFTALFGRPIDESQMAVFGMATGEAIACLNCLTHAGRATKTTDAEGVAWYHRRA